MVNWVTSITLFALAPLAGCASIDTYTDQSLTTKTGILYYPPKPYLLVKRTGAKDKPNEVEVIYLPDLSQPRYAVMRAGFGSSKLGLTFSNGLLVSVNQESDPKITEAITALAGVPGALATAAKTRAEASNLREEAADMPKAAAMARKVSIDLTDLAKDPQAGASFNPSQTASLARLPSLVDQAASALEAPGADDATAEAALKLLQQAKQILALIKPAGDPGDDAKEFWNRVRTAEGDLDKAIAELAPKEVEKPTLSLYEVLISANKTRLREVPLSTLETQPAGEQ